MISQHEAIVKECIEQSSSCQYTSTALYGWLGKAVWYNRSWNAIPIILGALASFGMLSNNFPVLAAFLAFIAGLLPAVYEKLELKAHTDEIKAQAGQYKNLEHRFRQAGTITALDNDPETLKMEFATLMRQIEDLRARPLVIPEKIFQEAREKVKDGRYKPDTDIMS